MQRSRQIFDVPLSSQRYTKVKEYINSSPDIRTLTDFGCGNGRFMLWLKQIPHLELVNCVDKDYAMLEYELDNCYFKPGFAEALFGRPSTKSDLDIILYYGDITIPDDRLRSDCLVMIELIEHMYPTEVEKATRSVFGFYRPKMVIVTTPNSEFNHLLREKDEPASQFRHYDHKFEWSRLQFQQWAEEVCDKFNYRVKFDGVGTLPNSESFGFCTQIAIFHRVGPHVDDSETVDLELNKLSVKENIEEWSMERRKNQLSKIIEYKIPSGPPEPTSYSDEKFVWNFDA